MRHRMGQCAGFGKYGGAAFGEECPAQAHGFGTGGKVFKRRALEHQPPVERQQHRRLDTVHNAARRGKQALSGGTRRCHIGLKADNILQPLLPVAGADRRLAVSGKVGTKCNGGLLHILDHRIDQTHGQRLWRRNGLSRQHKAQGRACADQSWRALCPARTGKQPKGNFGQTEPGARTGHTHMRRQCKFQTAPQCRPLNGSDDRLARGFDAVAKLWQSGHALRRGASEFADIGAGGKAGTDGTDHYGTNRRVRQRGVQPFCQTGAHRRPKGVHRRCVDRQNQHCPVPRLANRPGHRPTLPVRRPRPDASHLCKALALLGNALMPAKARSRRSARANAQHGKRCPGQTGMLSNPASTASSSGCPGGDRCRAAPGRSRSSAFISD